MWLPSLPSWNGSSFWSWTPSPRPMSPVDTMSQWAGGPGQPGFQYPMQTGFPGQQQPQFTQQQPQFTQQQQFGQPQQQFGQPQQQLGFGGLAPQPTGFPAMRPQPTGFPGGSPSGFAPQPTGFNAGMGRAMPPPVPPVPAQFQQQQSQFRAPPPPPPPQAQSQFMTGAQPSFLNTQPTGFAGGIPNRLLSQPTGIAPLVAQPTGFMDPRLTLMANNLLPGANYGAGLQQSFAQQTQERGKPKLSWALSKAEKKNYDQIFRAWDPRGTGFITGETALEVFGQSGLDKNDLARIWTLADTDNRGKLNVAEFHVAMGLIYRSLNGMPIPDQLPPELKPPSARDTEEAVDFLKSVLKNDSHTRSTNSVEPGGPMSYAKTRSFNEQQGAGGGGRKDATVYKYDNDSEGRKVYKSSARHLDRDSVKTGHETASEDLEDLKRQLENSSRALENATLAEASRSREDEELDRELDDLKRRVKRVKDDLEYVSRGPRSEKRDEDRRELEREMTYLLHERIPQVQKKIEERDRRKERERREWAKDRDYRNDRFGRFDDGGRSSPSSSYRRDDRDRDTGYLRGTYDRDDRDRNRDYDRYRDRDGGRRDSDRSRERDYDRPRDYDRDRDNRSRGGVEREREPERARTPQAAAPRSTTPGLSAPPSRAAAASPASTKNMTPEERQAFIRAEAQRRTQERMIKLGLAAPSASSTPVDTDVEQRLARERKEAEEKARKAEQEAEEREKARKARLQEARGESATPAPAAAPAPAPPAPAPPASAKKPPAPPPPKKRAPVPPPSRPSAPPAPAPVVAAAAPPAPPPPAAEPEEDPEEKRLRERREALRRQREELEREEREQEERRKRLEEQRKAAQAPPAAFPTSPPVVPAAPPAPPPPAVGGHNPFRPAGPPSAAAAVVSPAASTTSNSTNPFFPLVNPNANGAPAVSPSAAPPAPAPAPEAAAPPPPPPPPAPEQPRFAPPPAHIPPPPKSSYNTAPSDDESWDEIKEKESDDDSSDDEFANRKHRENIAQALFGGILPSSPAPPVRPQSAAATSKPNTPAPASFAPPPPAAPDAPPPPAPQAPAAPPPPPAAPMAPPPPPAAAGGPPVARPAGLGAVLGDIRSGARLRKTVTNDRSTAAVSGRVIGDAAPPPHVNAQPRPASPPSPPAFVPPPPPPPAAVSDESEGAAYASTARSDNRQSVDWYAGLAAHSMGAEHAAVASAIAALPETKEEDEYAPEAANANGHAVPDIRVDDYPAPAAEEDPLDDIDMNTEYRALSLYPYDAQRPEELSFVQNMILTVYPSKSGSEWWYGRSVSSGSKGFIPKTYIKTVEPQATLRAHAIYPWEATNADELSLAEGDVLTVIDRTDPDWWKVEKDGLVRVVPASYMEPVDG